MNFTLPDWSAVIAYLLITLLLGICFRSRSGKSVDGYFVSGGNLVNFRFTLVTTFYAGF